MGMWFVAGHIIKTASNTPDVSLSHGLSVISDFSESTEMLGAIMLLRLVPQGHWACSAAHPLYLLDTPTDIANLSETQHRWWGADISNIRSHLSTLNALLSTRSATVLHDEEEAKYSSKGAHLPTNGDYQNFLLDPSLLLWIVFDGCYREEGVEVKGGGRTRKSFSTT